MAQCFDSAIQINPINQLLVDVFGQNYYPPYSAAGQPVSQKDMGNDKLLQWKFPGNAQIKPPGNPQTTSIADLIAPMTSAMSNLFMFMGPIFIIIDVIRGIIDVICALLSPIPVISAVIQLLTTVIPPIIALFPPFAMVLVALNLCKLIVSIIVSMLSVIVPLIELIVNNALSITSLLAPPNFNIAAVDAVNLKICTLLQHLDNQIAGFSPLSLILEMFDLFAALAASLFCAPGNACCDSNTCPPLIVNPPVGRGRVINVNDVSAIRAILTEPVADLLGIVNTSIIQLDTSVSSANSLGLVSSKGVGSTYSKSELLNGQNYVVDPPKISAPASDGPANGPDSPYTLALEITNRSNNQTRTGRIKKIETSSSDTSKVMITIDRADFDLDTNVNYTLIPNMNTLLSMNLVGLGCVNDIALASKGLQSKINADVGATALTNNGVSVSNGFNSLRDKIGRDLPRPPISDLDGLSAQLAQDPTANLSEQFRDILLDYLDDVTNYYDNALCIGASRLNTEFSIDKTVIISDGTDSATISMTVKDQSGAALLSGLLPNSTATVEFYTTYGTIGPAILDDATGTYSATFTSSEIGEAEISAAFIVDNKECMVPGIFDGFTINDKTLRVRLLAKEESFNKRRQTNQYVQSGRGKRR